MSKLISVTDTEALRQRFGVWNGQFWGFFKFKNLNWYYSNGHIDAPAESASWFCFGDIREEDVARLQALLEPGEVLILGWKDLPPLTFKSEGWGDGGGEKIRITKDTVLVRTRARGK